MKIRYRTKTAKNSGANVQIPESEPEGLYRIWHSETGAAASNAKLDHYELAGVYIWTELRTR